MFSKKNFIIGSLTLLIIFNAYVASVSVQAYIIITTPPLTITITTPSGGENWQIGNSYNISWNYSGVPATSSISIVLSNSSSSNLYTIAANIPVGYGSYNWNVGSDIPASNNYKISISFVNYNETGVSNPFTIVAAPSINITTTTATTTATITAITATTTAATTTSDITTTTATTATTIYIVPASSTPTYYNYSSSTSDSEYNYLSTSTFSLITFYSQATSVAPTLQKNSQLLLATTSTAPDKLLPIISNLNKSINNIAEIKQEIMGIAAQIVPSDQLNQINTLISNYIDELKTVSKNITAQDIFLKDTNHRGISDFQKIIVYKVDPFKNSLAAITANTASTTQFEDAKIHGPVKSDFFEIQKLEIVVITTAAATTTIRAPIVATTTAIRISGKSLPRSYITLYIYSNNPVIITVKTDEYGNWNYIIDRPLAKGKHEIYTAINDNTGKILAKSQPFTFVKTAQAAIALTMEQPTILASPVNPVNYSQNYFQAIIISLIATALLIAILFIIKAAKKKDVY